MARRFIVKNEDIKQDGNRFEIFGEEVKHIQVLRHEEGDKIVVNDGIFEIEQMRKSSIILNYVEDAPKQGIPDTHVTLYMAVLKGDKMDLVIQKAVELGVSKIVPFFSTNVIVKLEDKQKAKRIEKFQKVADEACKQCGRMDTVEVADFVTFKEMKNELEDFPVALFAYEASNDSLRTEIKDIKDKNINDIAIIIGAEGGFTPKEAQELKEIENVKCVSLGSRILRAETAVFSLVSIIMYEMED